MPEQPGEPAAGNLRRHLRPGSFGHLRLAEEAPTSLGLAGIRWIPAGQPALRGVPQVTAGQRLAMVRLATAGNPRFASMRPKSKPPGQVTP
jgi:nicotinic acid mononucleotide adenylyltransferase